MAGTGAATAPMASDSCAICVRDMTFEPRGRRCLLLGAGGAARAVAFALADAGVETLVIANRTPSVPASSLLRSTRRTSRWSTGTRSTLAGAFDLVRARDCRGTRWRTARAAVIDRRARALCYDLSYGDAATPFLRLGAIGRCCAKRRRPRHARRAGGRVVCDLARPHRPKRRPVFGALRREHPLAGA